MPLQPLHQALPAAISGPRRGLAPGGLDALRHFRV